MRLDGRRELSLVVFGEDDSEPILGAVALEEFLLVPDPVRRRLVPVPGLMMGCRPERQFVSNDFIGSAPLALGPYTNRRVRAIVCQRLAAKRAKSR